MDIRVLQYFLAVAREQSISGAAEALHMTQPPLSKQLKALEDELGKQLFVRGSRHITLTREGVLLRRRAEEIVALMERTRDEIRTADEAVTGDVYIGGGETEGMRVIAGGGARARNPPRHLLPLSQRGRVRRDRAAGPRADRFWHTD